MCDPAIVEDDAYTMANLHPADTGLPMVVWVSERGNARHDARVKVCQALGPTMQFNNTVSVAVRPEPHLVRERKQKTNLTTTNLALAFAWIRRNETMIVDYWNGTISTVEMVQRLIPIEPEPPLEWREDLFIARIKELAETTGKSVTAVMREAGVASETLRKPASKGHRIDIIIRVAQAFDVDIGEFINQCIR